MHHVRSRILGSAVPFAVCLFGILGAAASAQAAAPSPFAITETVTGQSPTRGGMGTFLATGVCSKGTWVDTVQVFAPPNPNSPAPEHSGRANLLVTTVYTCENGDTFNALKHLAFNLATGTVTGQIQLLGGTGAFTNLVGHGVDNGSLDTGIGEISGFITQP